MKRALSAAVVGGLMIFAVPQAAFADHDPGHHGGESAEQPQKSPEPDEQAPEDAPRGDRESHDNDGGFLLF